MCSPARKKEDRRARGISRYQRRVRRARRPVVPVVVNDTARKTAELSKITGLVAKLRDKFKGFLLL
jgi:hypothetical protein